jgi:FMN-dependent NADH-azoreductase
LGHLFDLVEENAFMKLLRVDSSARTSSVSRALTDSFVAAWKKEHPEGEVVERDLAKITQPKMVTDEWTQAIHTDPAKLTAGQRELIAQSETMIAELFAAHTIVIGAPMYNFSISWPLKAWIDQVVRAGKTFGYGANGRTGLLLGKRVVVITSRAGSYPSGTDNAKIDFQEPYLRHMMDFIGVTDLTFIHAENQRPGGELAEPSRAAALERIGVVAVERELAASGAETSSR